MELKRLNTLTTGELPFTNSAEHDLVFSVLSSAVTLTVEPEGIGTPCALFPYKLKG